MRIVLLQSVVALGGFEQHMLNLATGLRELGYEAEIMGLLNAGGFSRLQEAGGYDVPVHFPAGWPQDPQPAWDMLAGLRPDIVNVQLPVPQVALEYNDAPVVATIHSEFSLDALPRCVAAVCLDQRWYTHTAEALCVPVYRARNGIDLARFPYRRDVAKREGLAAWGRFDPEKLGPARAVCETTPVDCWGDFAPLPDTGLRGMGISTPEEICYKYRIITSTGLCALETMACGALHLTPEPTEESLGAWADMSYWLPGIYPPGNEQAVRLDLATLLTMDAQEAQERADFCREWVEREHDCLTMAERFAEVYESTGGAI